MRNEFWIGVAAMMLGASGCQKVESDFSPQTDFTRYRTFAWEVRQSNVESEADRDYPHLMGEIREQVDAGLKHRGFVPADVAAADLTLEAHLELAPYQLEPDANGDGATDVPSRQLGPVVLAPYSVTEMDNGDVNRELQSGTLLLNMRDRAGDVLVWQGWVGQVMDMENVRTVEWKRKPAAGDVRYRQRMIARLVNALLKEFPPKQR